MKVEAGDKFPVIVAAGGSGTRFQASIGKEARKIKTGASGKLFFELDGKPILLRTLENLTKSNCVAEIIVAAPKNELDVIRKMIAENLTRKIIVVAGGKTRADSVRNGLRKIKTRSRYVMVHDGARPLIHPNSIELLVKQGKAWDGAILASKVVPTIKEVDLNGRVLRTVDRSRLYEAETPQFARIDLLLKAYRTNINALNATDEASLIESVGGKVCIVSHDQWNPKITRLEDLNLAEGYLNQKMDYVTGFGKDTHRLVEGRKLYLGGLEIPHDRGTLGHSDGDALLHAIADAVLGCLAKGDIGDWFSDQNAKYKNIRSSKLIAPILDEANRGGFQISHIDAVITLEKPKLGPFKEKIKLEVSKILKLKPTQVSIKAKTNEGLGAEGGGFAVTCEAIVTMKKVK